MAVRPSQFEAHAGFPSRRKPYMQGEATPHRALAVDRAWLRFRSIRLLKCVGLSAIPRGIWYCKYCQNMFEKEQCAEPDANAVAAGRVSGVDPLEAITQWCIHVVGTFEPEIGGCAICRRHLKDQDFCDMYCAVLMVE
ncbi:UNVERIFIED_CONTAM: hypothetical protein Scaly_2241000 [Sesamum calycinum]|uniref:Uncharacterized protein n=1 Tax=Sesamum calycinum TaxID=2727403 RepID=A0AAW2M9B8_9LAMI